MYTLSTASQLGPTETTFHCHVKKKRHPSFKGTTSQATHSPRKQETELRPEGKKLEILSMFQDFTSFIFIFPSTIFMCSLFFYLSMFLSAFVFPLFASFFHFSSCLHFLHFFISKLVSTAACLKQGPSQRVMLRSATEIQKQKKEMQPSSDMMLTLCSHRCLN